MHGMQQPLWLECEGDWMPKAGADTIPGEPDPQYIPGLVQRFRKLMQAESDRIMDIVR